MTTTEYTHRVTIAVPESLMKPANHLACILGESAADIHTFSAASHQDPNGQKYAVCSAVVKPAFFQAQTGQLPTIPDFASGVADPQLAQQALDTLGQDGGLRMAVDEDPQQALDGWGLTVIPDAGV